MPISGPIKALLRSLRLNLPHLLLIAAALAILIRLTLRDRIPYLAALYYASPLILVSLAVFIAALIYLKRRFRIAATACLISCIPLAAWHFSNTWRLPDALDSIFRNPGASPPLTLRVLQWNTARGMLGWDDAIRTILDLHPDIAFLNEAASLGRDTPEGHDNPIDAWRRDFPGYHVSSTGVSSVLLSKYPIELQGLLSLAGRGHIVRFRIHTPAGIVHCLLVDLDANPIRPRGPALRRLIDHVSRIATRRPQRPILVAGDFNTPHDSFWMDHLLHVTGLRNTFDLAGRGYRPTWPSIAPMLAIDHILVSPHFHVRDAYVLNTLDSDHRPIIAELEIIPPVRVIADTPGE